MIGCFFDTSSMILWNILDAGLNGEYLRGEINIQSWEISI
ncbi:hypothetical protein J2X61_005930 [Bacillus sp. 3255]|nr:hypothetical protein [Bacillus sp. 3255]